MFNQKWATLDFIAVNVLLLTCDSLFFSIKPTV